MMQNLPISYHGSNVMYKMYKNYVYIITELTCYKRIEIFLHHLLCHDRKYENLMHNCVFTYIRKLSPLR